MTVGTSGFCRWRQADRIDPASGRRLRSIEVAGNAGTAFYGQHLFSARRDRIQKIDPKTGRVLSTIRRQRGSGSLGRRDALVGQYRDRKIHQSIRNGGHSSHHRVDRFRHRVTWIDVRALATAPGKVTEAI